MSASSVFKAASGLGGLASNRALIEGAGEIINIFDSVNKRSYSLEAAPSAAPTFQI